MKLLVFAVLYSFGLRQHVGAEALSDFFRLIRLDSHVGVSPGALRTQLRQMEALLPAFQHQCEASAPAPRHKVVLAADETFFGEILILVLMDLASGYLLLESIQDDRSFDTWFAQAAPRLEARGIQVGHAISDRAKALIKLAVDGFGCASGADTFHEQYGLSRWLLPALGRRQAKAVKQSEAAQKALESLPAGASAETRAVLETQQAHAGFAARIAVSVRGAWGYKNRGYELVPPDIPPFWSGCKRMKADLFGRKKARKSLNYAGFSEVFGLLRLFRWCRRSESNRHLVSQTRF